MKIRPTRLIALLFLLAEFASAFYVFNYTTRTRRPVLSFGVDEELSCLGISNWGDSFAVGGEDGTVSYFSLRKASPRWEYHGESGVRLVTLSSEGDYVVALDGDSTVALFSGLPGGEVEPRWTYQLDGGEVAGVYATGGMPSLVYVLATEGGSILLLSDREGLEWEYKTGASGVVASLSFDGRHVAAADSEGFAYLFSVNDPEPVWRVPTGLRASTISLSMGKQMAVGGTLPDGGGAVYALSLTDGSVTWEWRSGEPVRSASMSSDGSKVFAQLDGGGVYVLMQKGGGVEGAPIAVPGGASSAWSPPFGSYVLALNPEGLVYFLYVPRSAPLWRYDSGGGGSLCAVTSTGDRVFVAAGREVAVISNAFNTGFIPGSRSLWGLVFLSGVSGTIAMIYALRGRPVLSIGARGYLNLLIGFSAGAATGFLLIGSYRALLVGGVSCALGGLYGLRREGISGIISGFAASLIVSVAVGYLFGLAIWFGGAESDIITLTITNAVEGGRMGVIFGLIGATLGLTLRRIPSPGKEPSIGLN